MHGTAVRRQSRVSPLKGLQKYFGIPGIISLAGGLPHPDYFPFTVVSSEILPYDHFQAKSTSKARRPSWFWKFWSGKWKNPTVSIPKYPTAPEDVSLSTALQYSTARGLPQLQDFIYKFTSQVYKPAYGNFATMIDIGNTDGWAKARQILCEPGQGIFTSEWTYPSAIANMRPHGLTPIPIPMDGQGMRSDALRDVLVEWDEATRGMPRPHVLYIIPVGQNPTGATMGLERKKAIYDVCVEYDIIIVEDDPYYFLQEGAYLPPNERDEQVESDIPDEIEQFLSRLSPSFLRVDYQGRVIRLDSFSKTIAPGSRLGWCTCNPLFAEKIERVAETSSQAPCGFGQSIISTLLLEWKYEGYIRWLRGLCLQYTQRRDFFIDCLLAQFDLSQSVPTEGIWRGNNVYTAYRGTRASLDAKNTKKNQALFSFVPPTSGMFVWLQMHFEYHPLFPSHGSKALETKLWLALAEAGLLIGNGSIFAGDQEVQLHSDFGHFRISFSNAELMDLKKAVDIFASVLESFYEVEA